MTTQSKYRRWHDAIIERARVRQAQGAEVEGDRHHVVPKSLGGSNDRSNIVKLTYREHFLVHWLLIKLTEGKARGQMKYALRRMMSSRGATKRRDCFVGWQYDLARKAHMEVLRSPESLARLKHIMSDPKVRAKKSHNMKLLMADPEVRTKRLIARNDPEYKIRHSERTALALSDPDVKSRQSAGLRRAFANSDRKANLSKIAKQRWSDPEYKARRLANIKKAISDPIAVARRTAGIKRASSDPEIRAQRSARMRRIGADPDFRIKVSERTKQWWEARRLAESK